jgi:alpha-methylacyl-CoA racemase
MFLQQLRQFSFYSLGSFIVWGWQICLMIGQVALSRGKRSLTLDMRSPEAIDVLKRLARTVDVVVENAKPGSMEVRSFGYSQARAENARIIWCAITGFGQSGPYVARGGHDVSYLAHSGLLSALLERSRTSAGAFLDISLAEAAGWYLTCGVNPLAERPFSIPSTPDRRLYQCGDGRYVVVASSEPRTWAALCDALGIPELKGTLHKPDEAAITADRY